MWIKKPGSVTVADFQPLLDEIVTRTGLPIGLDGFTAGWHSCRPGVDARIPVANRYFGVFQSGEIKVRGIELRRHDTPDFIKELQQQMLDILAKTPDVEKARELLPEVQALVRRRLADLRRGAYRRRNLSSTRPSAGNWRPTAPLPRQPWQRANWQNTIRICVLARWCALCIRWENQGCMRGMCRKAGC